MMALISQFSTSRSTCDEGIPYVRLFAALIDQHVCGVREDVAVDLLTDSRQNNHFAHFADSWQRKE